MQNSSACKEEEEKKKKRRTMATFMKKKKHPKVQRKASNAPPFSPRPPDWKLCSRRRRCGPRGSQRSSLSSSNLLRHWRHLQRIIQMCHYFLMGIMLSRQSGSLHQMCSGGGDLRKLILCCKTNGRKLIPRYSSHYERRGGGAGGAPCTDKVTLGW